MFNWYFKLIAAHPGLILLITGVLSAGLSVVAVVVAGLPDFADPLKGFETRKTDISGRLTAWHNLEDNVKRNEIFYQFPRKVLPFVRKSSTNTQRKRRKVTLPSDDYCEALSRPSNRSKGKSAYCYPKKDDSPPDDNFAQVIFKAESFGAETLWSLCEYEALVGQLLCQAGLHNHDTCQYDSYKEKNCCNAWHLGSLAAAMLDRHHCSQLTRADSEFFWNSIKLCSTHADVILRCRKKPTPTEKSTCLASIPKKCRSALMLTVFFNLIERNAVAFQRNDSDWIDGSFLTAMFLPVQKGGEFVVNGSSLIDKIISTPEHMDLTEYYKAEQLLNQTTVLGSVSHKFLEVVGIDFDVRFQLFQLFLLKDAVWGVLAVVLVLITMWLYSGSLMFTLFGLAGIILSVGTSYFLYTIVFRIRFFPFINLLTVVLLIGIGADDICVYQRAWLMAKSDRNPGPLTKVIGDTMSHACASMLVSSVTTAAAFFANLVGDVIVIRCFGIFAGTTVLSNYLFVVTWLPATVVLTENVQWGCCSWVVTCLKTKVSDEVKIQSRWSSVTESDPSTVNSVVPIQRIQVKRRRKRFIRVLMAKLNGWYYLACEYGRIFFEKLLPWVVVRLRYFWLASLSAVAIAAAVVVFYRPGISLPSRNYFMLLKASHPLERFHKELKEKFAYLTDTEYYPMPIRVVWGVKPVDNSDLLNPHVEGHTEVDETFRLNDSLTLLWFRQFCNDLAVQKFTAFGNEPMLPYCFVPDFMDWMKRDCKDPGGDRTKTNFPCCRNSVFPYPPGVIEKCVQTAAFDFDRHQQSEDLYFLSGPLFPVNTTNRVGGVVVSFLSRHNFTFSYHQMRQFHEEVGGWVKAKIAEGPASVRGGWFVSELKFYDIQRSLVDGTKLSVLIAVAIAFLVLVCCTLNVVISLLAIISIASVIIVTVASLILLEWELNVLESTIIILTVGLSFDYTLHYAVAYRLCEESEREFRVAATIGRMASPIFISGVTTFLAGAAMLPSTTVAYFQIGLFMILVTLISWLYANCFFMSLLCCFGKTDGFCQLNRQSFALDWNGRRTGELGGGGSASVSRAHSGNSSCVIPRRRVDIEPLEQSAKTGVHRESTRSRKIGSFRQSLKNRSTSRNTLPVVKRLSSMGLQKQTITAESIFADPDSQTIAFIDEDYRDSQIGDKGIKDVEMESLQPINTS